MRNRTVIRREAGARRVVAGGSEEGEWGGGAAQFIYTNESIPGDG